MNSQPESKAFLTPLSLLLVEDDRIDQMAFRHLVENEHLDYEYSIASSIHEAWAILHSRHIDIIIADYNLEDGTALDILTKHHDSPLIIVTGAGNESVAVQAMKAGAYDYLTKDIQHNYLKLIPIVVENAVKRRIAEGEAGELLRERIRREILQDFIRDMSHDLRTSLTTPGTSLYLLSRYVEDMKTLINAPNTHIAAIKQTALKIEDRIQLLKEYQKHLEQVILDMLEMVKIDDLSPFEMEIYDLNTLIERAIQPYKRRADRKGQDFTYTLHSEPLFVMASPDHLASIVRNLLKNAIDYTDHGGSITVKTERVNEEAVLSVIDTGVGIASQDLNRIFNRFYRVNSARTMSGAGSGLGLSIAKQLVDLHKGRIEVESVISEGSTFKVFLPLVSV
jgi:two-component system, sensor histidine kinase and response regulator